MRFNNTAIFNHTYVNLATANHVKPVGYDHRFRLLLVQNQTTGHKEAWSLHLFNQEHVFA